LDIISSSPLNNQLPSLLGPPPHHSLPARLPSKFHTSYHQLFHNIIACHNHYHHACHRPASLFIAYYATPLRLIGYCHYCHYAILPLAAYSLLRTTTEQHHHQSPNVIFRFTLLLPLRRYAIGLRQRHITPLFTCRRAPYALR
jgi:hypothetical protein